MFSSAASLAMKIPKLYYEAHLGEMLERLHLKKYTKYNDDGTPAVDLKGVYMKTGMIKILDYAKAGSQFSL